MRSDFRAEAGYYFGEVFGERTFQFYVLTCARVDKFQALSVKALTLKSLIR